MAEVDPRGALLGADPGHLGAQYAEEDDAFVQGLVRDQVAQQHGRHLDRVQRPVDAGPRDPVDAARRELLQQLLQRACALGERAPELSATAGPGAHHGEDQRGDRERYPAAARDLAQGSSGHIQRRRTSAKNSTLVTAIVPVTATP